MTDERIEEWKGIAEALGKTVRVAKLWEKNRSLPVRRDPGGIGAKPRVYILRSELERWRNEADANAQSEFNDVAEIVETPVGPLSKNLLFRYAGGHANALKLYGRGEGYVSPERLFVKYRHDRYRIPKELEIEANRHIERRKREARNENKRFFNGPCVRLIEWHRNQEGGAESDTLELVLGPIGWYDFEGTNGLVRDQSRIANVYKKFVDIEAVIHSNSIEKSSRLSNLIGNAITIFTSDGKVGYHRRGVHQSAVPKLTSSAVAENVNRYKDDFDQRERQLVNPPQARATAKETDDQYSPKGLPSLYSAVRRGIREETSPKLLDYIPVHGIKMTGLAFGLDCLHPDALWIVLMDITEARFKQISGDKQGSDWDEGEIKFVPAIFGAKATREVLKRNDWVAAGKASLIRALELIDSTSNNPLTAFNILAESR